MLNILQVKDIEDFVQQKNGEIEEIRKIVSVAESMLPFSEMTMEDIVEYEGDGILLPGRVTTWPHTAETQECNAKEEDDENGH